MSGPLVLLNLPWLRDKDPRATLGDASLRARLARQREVEQISVSRPVNGADFSREELAQTLMKECRRPSAMLGIGCYVWNEAVVQWLLPELRRRGFRGRIVLGGPQITYARHGVDRLYPDADVFVRGYGEDALAAVARDPGISIPGVTHRGKDAAIAFAEVDYGKLDSPTLSGLLPLDGFQRWETQRGCLFRCAFCQWPGGIDGVHRLSADRIDAECAMFANSSTTEIAIQDPIFNSRPRDWLAPLVALDRHGYGGRVSMQLRPETFGDPRAFLDLPIAPRCKLEFGVQSINERELKEIDRSNNLAKCDEILRLLVAEGMFVEISLIHGLPHQTLDSFRESVAWARDHAVAVRAFPLQLSRGTPLELRRAELGLVVADGPIPYVVESPSYSGSDYAHMERLAAELVTEADSKAERWRGPACRERNVQRQPGMRSGR